MVWKPRPAQLELHLLRRPVESSQEAGALIPEAQVRQGGGRVKEEGEVPKEQGALFSAQFTDGLEKTALASLALQAERTHSVSKNQNLDLFLRTLSE